MATWLTKTLHAHWDPTIVFLKNLPKLGNPNFPRFRINSAFFYFEHEVSQLLKCVLLFFKFHESQQKQHVVYKLRQICWDVVVFNQWLTHFVKTLSLRYHKCGHPDMYWDWIIIVEHRSKSLRMKLATQPWL